MGKRKEDANNTEEDIEDVVNVDFDFFDIVEDDFLSVKSLLRQLLGLDSVQFNLSSLAQLVVDAKVGTTIKTDDEEYNDALAVLAVANFDLVQGETSLLFNYWIDQAKESPELLRALLKIQVAARGATLGGTLPPKIGLLISERFLNMPFDVVPPLYQVLCDEYAARRLDFDYLLLPSRMYNERASTLNGGNGEASEMYAFHPEDPYIDVEAIASATFPFNTPVDETDSRRAFQDNGIHPYGHLAVIEAAKLPEIAKKIASIH